MKQKTIKSSGRQERKRFGIWQKEQSPSGCSGTLPLLSRFLVPILWWHCPCKPGSLVGAFSPLETYLWSGGPTDFHSETSVCIFPLLMTNQNTFSPGRVFLSNVSCCPACLWWLFCQAWGFGQLLSQWFALTTVSSTSWFPHILRDAMCSNATCTETIAACHSAGQPALTASLPVIYIHSQLSRRQESLWSAFQELKGWALIIGCWKQYCTDKVLCWLPVGYIYTDSTFL